MSANGPYTFGFIDSLVRINFPHKFLVEMHWEWSDYGNDGLDAWATGGGTTTLEVTYNGSGIVTESHYEPTQISYSPVAFTPPTLTPYNLTINIPTGGGVNWYNPNAQPDADQDGYVFSPVFTQAEAAPVEVTPPTAYAYQYGTDNTSPLSGSPMTTKFHTEVFYFSGSGDIKFSVRNALPSVAVLAHVDGPFFPTSRSLTINNGTPPSTPGLPPDVGTFPEIGSIKYTGANGFDYTGTSPVGRSTVLRGGDVGIGFTAIVYSADDFKYDTVQKKIVLRNADSGAEPLSVTSTGGQDFFWQDGPGSTPTDNAIESYIPPPYPIVLDSTTRSYGIVPPGFDGTFVFRIATGTTTNKKKIAVLWPLTPKAFMTQAGVNTLYPSYQWRLGDNANSGNWLEFLAFGNPPNPSIA